MEIILVLITAAASILSSTGVWTYLQSRNNRNGAEIRLLKGVSHTLLIRQCMVYVRRGAISNAEFIELSRMLYEPYKDVGGNGSAERAFDMIRNLPISNSSMLDDLEQERNRRELNE